MTIWPELVSVTFDPEPADLPADPSEFCVLVLLEVGPRGSAGSDSFSLTVCSPEWLARRSREVGIVDARRHLVIGLDRFDRRSLVEYLERRVRRVQGDSWQAVASKVGRLAAHEFEDQS